MKPPIQLLAVALVVLATGCKDAREQAKEKEVWNEISNEHETFRKELKEGMTDEGLVIDQEAIERQHLALQSAGEKLGGVKGQALEIMAGFQRESAAWSGKIEEGSQKMVTAIDFSNLGRDNDYEERREVLRDYMELNQQVTDYFETAPDEVIRKLDAINFHGKDRRDMEAGFTNQIAKMKPLIRGIRECDRVCCEISLRMIDILEKEKGMWTWNEAEGMIEFENDDAIAAFNKEVELLTANGQKQLDLQQELVNTL